MGTEQFAKSSILLSTHGNVLLVSKKQACTPGNPSVNMKEFVKRTMSEIYNFVYGV